MISIQTTAVISAIIFTAGILIPLFMKKHNSMIRLPLWVSSAVLILSFCFASRLFHAGPYLFFGSLFVVDTLAVFHVFLDNLIFPSLWISRTFTLTISPTFNSSVTDLVCSCEISDQ